MFASITQYNYSKGFIDSNSNNKCLVTYNFNRAQISSIFE